MNPYRIEGPACISFSGGRSSGYMLCKIVEAYAGALPEDMLCLFANTGKEREETYEFIERVAKHLAIKIHWLEYRKGGVAEVSYPTASGKGEPFREMVLARAYMPNPVARTCTEHLKIKPMESYMRSQLDVKPGEYANITGMRADEPRRVARGRTRTDVDMRFPLFDAGVTAEMVREFWKAMPFDLELPSSEFSNCDLCYLKGAGSLISLIRHEPARADWWIDLEAETGSTFRTDRPNYAAMKYIALQPGLFDDPAAEAAMPCECTD